MIEHVKTHRVEWGETDTAAIIFYPNYFRWFDTATHDLFRSIGYPVSHMIDRGFAIPIVDCGARFFQALAYEDEVRIVSRIAEVRTRGFRVEHTVHRGEGLIAEGHEVRVCIKMGARGEPLEALCIPDDLRAILTR